MATEFKRTESEFGYNVEDTSPNPAPTVQQFFDGNVQFVPVDEKGRRTIGTMSDRELLIEAVEGKRAAEDIITDILLPALRNNPMISSLLPGL